MRGLRPQPAPSSRTRSIAASDRLRDQGTELLLLYRSNAPAYGDLVTDERMGRIAGGRERVCGGDPG